jgi:hypothetical protein
MHFAPFGSQIRRQRASDEAATADKQDAGW